MPAWCSAGVARAVVVALAEEGHVADVVDRLGLGRLVVRQIEVDIKDDGGVLLPLHVLQVQAQVLWLARARRQQGLRPGGGVVIVPVMLVATDDRCMGPPEASVMRVTAALEGGAGTATAAGPRARETGAGSSS